MKHEKWKRVHGEDETQHIRKIKEEEDETRREAKNKENNKKIREEIEGENNDNIILTTRITKQSTAIQTQTNAVAISSIIEKKKHHHHRQP